MQNFSQIMYAPYVVTKVKIAKFLKLNYKVLVLFANVWTTKEKK